MNELNQAIERILPKVQNLRRDLHKHPELSWQESRSQKTLLSLLGEVPGLEISEIAKHGILADLRGSQPGPCIGLRADMDALPIHERTGADYASQNDGVMHACGHDGHMANLMGTALVLSELRDQIRGRVRFIFQPAEEGALGGKVLCEEGGLEGVDQVFGLHGWPELPVGQIYVKPGPMMASFNEFRVTITGTGGHGAMPHLCTDQILAAAKFIEAVQAVASKHVSPVDAVVLSFGSIVGGSAPNVIPDQVALTGTFRTLRAEVHEKVLASIRQIASGIGTATGTKIQFDLLKSVPSVENHPEATERLRRITADAIGACNVKSMPAPTMGAEDFSFYLRERPGSFFFLGLGDGGPSLHDPHFNFNDDALATGIKVMASLVLAN